MRRALPPLALLLLLLCTSCDSIRGTMDDSPPPKASARDELLTRPTLEEEVGRLRKVQDDARQALTAELGLTSWSAAAEPDLRAGCADLPGADGQTVFLQGLVLAGGVADEQWPRAVQTLVAVAGRSGFGPPETVVDRPGQHRVVLRGERGSMIRFGSSGNATLAVEVGCHLPASEHRAR